jgi:hypothetical protein
MYPFWYFWFENKPSGNPDLITGKSFFPFANVVLYLLMALTRRITNTPFIGCSVTRLGEISPFGRFFGAG